MRSKSSAHVGMASFIAQLSMIGAELILQLRTAISSTISNFSWKIILGRTHEQAYNAQCGCLEE